MNAKVIEEAIVNGSSKKVWQLVTESKHFQSWYAFGGAIIDLRPGGLISFRKKYFHSMGCQYQVHSSKSHLNQFLQKKQKFE